MVKGVMSTISMAVAVADDDVTSLLQLSAGVRMSKGQSIFAAVAKGDDTICVQAAAGDVAPVIGSFTARMGHQAVMVAAGSVAGEAGTFCAAKQDVLLIQRTFGLNTAHDFEVALGSKKNNKATTTTTTTTTPMDIEIFDFEGNLSKKDSVWVGDRWSKDIVQWKGTSPVACPKSSSPVVGALLQTMDATVADKQQKAKKKAEKKAGPRLDDDEMRVCECRSFLMSSAGKIWNEKLIDTLKPLKALIPEPAPAAPADPAAQSEASEAYQEWRRAANARSGLPEVDDDDAQGDPLQDTLLQRNFDAAIATKKKKKVTTTTTTTTIDHTEVMNEACAAASLLPSWTLVAKWINHPDVAALYKEANITEGWRHCDKSWVVHGACGDFLPATVTSCSAHFMQMVDQEGFPNCAQIDWQVPAWESCRPTDSEVLALGSDRIEWRNREPRAGACGGTRTGSKGLWETSKWSGGVSRGEYSHIMKGDQAFQRPNAVFPSFPNGQYGGSSKGYRVSWWNTADKAKYETWNLR